MKRETKITLASLLAIIAVCTMIAAVPGIFSFVNSSSGYLVNGSAGSSGQALCSDGSYYNTPCSLANPFYQTLKANGTAQPQEPAINFSNQFTLSDTSGIQTNVALANFTPRTCNVNGCYEIVNGTVTEWGHVTGIADGGSGTNFTMPLTFPTAVDSCTAVGDFASGGSRIISVASISTTQFNLHSDGSGEGGYFQCKGH